MVFTPERPKGPSHTGEVGAAALLQGIGGFRGLVGHGSQRMKRWYFSTAGKRTGLGQYDYKGHYLAYHEGAGGYLKGTYKSKRWLVDVAAGVAKQASRYEAQISKCDALRDKFLGIF